MLPDVTFALTLIETTDTNTNRICVTQTHFHKLMNVTKDCTTLTKDGVFTHEKIDHKIVPTETNFFDQHLQKSCVPPQIND